jgi:phage-related protein
MQTLGQLVLKIAADTAGAEKGIAGLNQKVSGAFSALKLVIGAIAAGAMAKWIDTTVKLGIESERAASLFGNTMRTTLGATDEQIAAAQKLIEKQEKLNHFDAEVLMGQMDKAIVKYGDLGTAQLAVSAAQEVARLKGINVAAAYDLVAQASNGTARSLKQFGIEAKKGTTEASYLQEILDKTAGSTEAYNKTTAGMVEGMKLSYEVMRETLGQALLPIAKTLMEVLSPVIEKITAFIVAHMPQIQAFVLAIQKGIAWVVETAGKMYNAIKPFIVSVTETLGPYIKELFTWLSGKGGAGLQKVMVDVATVLGMAFTGLGIVIKAIVDSIEWIIKHAKEAIEWLKGIGANQGVNQGGVAVPYIPPPHASGGWVGMNGPELALVGERGPEYIVPNDRLGSTDYLLGKLIARVDTLIAVTNRIPGGIGAVVNGIGRGG